MVEFYQIPREVDTEQYNGSIVRIYELGFLTTTHLEKYFTVLRMI